MSVTDAKLVHRTRGRMRWRIPSKKRDLGYFVKLYDKARQLPEVDEVIINPKTASVLFHYDEYYHSGLSSTLNEPGFFSSSQMNEPQAAFDEKPDDPGANTKEPSEATPSDMRFVLFLVMLGMSVHQVLKGQIMAPAITVILYAIDLGAQFRKEHLEGDKEEAGI